MRIIIRIILDKKIMNDKDTKKAGVKPAIFINSENISPD